MSTYQVSTCSECGSSNVGTWDCAECKKRFCRSCRCNCNDLKGDELEFAINSVRHSIALLESRIVYHVNSHSRESLNSQMECGKRSLKWLESQREL